MYYITLEFAPIRSPINVSIVTARGLHGMLFNILQQTDKLESDWLHQHSPPRPFSLLPLYTDKGDLTGMRLAAITERTATLFIRTGEWFQKQGHICHVAGHEFIIHKAWHTPRLSWEQLAHSQPERKMGLKFISPTTFKQGPGHLPLPLPDKIFHGPMRIWQAFAPPMMQLPDNWLDWCSLEVFVTRHNIQTLAVKISKREQIVGFVGEVWLSAHQGDKQVLCTWQALADLASFCGIGYKTTMGMGALERLPLS